MLKVLKKNNYLFIYLIIIGIINLLLLSLPLVNVFGYEFSTLNALLLSFLSGLFSISFLTSSVNEFQKFNVENYLSALRWMFFLPFAISVLNSIIFEFCSFTDGLLFYLAISLPSLIIGSALGSTIFVLVKKFRIVSFILLYLLILFTSVLEIYFNPQVYLYNPLFAYFPGTIYDEGLSVDLRLFLYRIFNLIFFLPILFYSIKLATRGLVLNKKLSVTFIAILISGFFYFFISPTLGFTTTESRLDKYLPNRIESKHFIIHSDKTIENDKLKYIVLSHEYYYSQLTNFFKLEPSEKIKSFIFLDGEQKKKLFGSGSADVAKPWLNSIYVSADTWERTTKHEIAHCFTAGFGTGIFKLASGFNPALIEGVAEAADGYYDENNINYLASLAYKNDFRVNLNSIFNSFTFFGSVSSLAYIYSGSFIKYLTDHYGIEKVEKYYAGGDFNESFSANLDSVIIKYETFLDTLASISTKNKANYYFGRKPLISKICPRYIASSLAEAWDSYSSNNLSEAKNIFDDIISRTESYSAIIGLSKIYEDEDSLSNAINLLQTSVNSFKGTSYEYDIKFRLADLFAKNSELETAEELYSFLIIAKPNRRLELVSNVRISLLKNGFLKKYVLGSDYDKYEILKSLNLKNYNYASIPLMIDLSETLGENYQLFLSNFVNNLNVKDEISSYALYKLSNYMLQNLDYVRARKMAVIALRFRGNPDLLKLVENYSKKTEWFLKNATNVIAESNLDSRN